MYVLSRGILNIKKYSNKLSMKALVEKSMLRKIKKLLHPPSFTLISHGNPKELNQTQGNSRGLKGSKGAQDEPKETKGNSSEII